jgi:hypothetical protein
VQGLAAIPPFKHVFEEHILVAGADELVDGCEVDPVSVEPVAVLPSIKISKHVVQEFINALL